MDKQNNSMLEKYCMHMLNHNKNIVNMKLIDRKTKRCNI